MIRCAEIVGRMPDVAPIKTEVEAVLDKLEGIECVVFDLYGTLLVSAAGDISLSDSGVSISAMRQVMRFLNLETIGGQHDPRDWVSQYRDVIASHHQVAHSRGIEFPEVEIREVWYEVLQRIDGPTFDPETIESLAMIYECQVNPVSLMPGALELLVGTERAGISLGIISNAQFYTEVVLQHLLGDTLDRLGFNQEMVLYSYELQRAKPSPEMFNSMVAKAAAKGISPEQILYVGNDMMKDILPAKACGMTAGWFAGDLRSLRTGGRTVDECVSVADVVITELSQLHAVLGIER